MNMHIGIKRFLRKTPFYPPLVKLRRNRQFTEPVHSYWKCTEDDERKATFYKQFVSRGDLVFDVGANLGNRSKVFWKLGAQIVAFEPQVKCCDFLRKQFDEKPSVQVVNRALAGTEGVTEMLIADDHNISSLSSEWVETVRKSGRFSQYKWEATQRVETTTLDKAIQEFGVPSFIKIDVEGYELEVLSGLSKPIKCISIEFIPEYIQNTFNCIDHMSSLSPIEAQISFGESMKMDAPSWFSADKIKEVLADAEQWRQGDVYIRCLNYSS